jgi:DNA-binding MarR family transcriptional regulator
MYRLSQSLPYLLNRTGTRLGELFAEQLREHDLAVPMYRVLAALAERDGLRLGELSGQVSVEVSTLSRLVGTLQCRKLVRRTRPSNNGRVVEIRLTRGGRALVDRLMSLAIAVEERASRGLSKEELRTFAKMLADIHANLDGQPA